MPTPTPVNVDELSEEEMVVAVESSAQGATDSTEQAVQYAEDAASDGELTADEIQMIELYFSVADEEIEQALELVALYASAYAELAEETINLLYAVEEDLSSLSQSAGEIYDTLVYIDQSIEAGQELVQGTIIQLQTQAENIHNQIEEVKNQSGDWVTAIKNDLQSRPDRYLDIEPDEIFTDRKDVLAQVKDYVEVVQTSLLDGIINRSEMDRIALQGANAVAGLDTLGGQDRVDMERFSDSINGVTAQLARGDLPQARSGIDNLQRSLPRR